MPTHTLTSRRADVTAVHSVDHFVFTVPDLQEALRFYSAFGLDVRQHGLRLDLYTHGHPHCWASIHKANGVKQLQYIRYGIFAEDLPVFRSRVQSLGLGIEPHPLSREPQGGESLWLRNPDGVALELVVADKVSPSAKTLPSAVSPVPRGQGAAPSRSRVSPVRPRYLSHILCFTPDVPRMIAFNHEVLGLRLADHSGDVIAFIYSPHGSDHHLVATDVTIQFNRSQWNNSWTNWYKIVNDKQIVSGGLF